MQLYRVYIFFMRVKCILLKKPAIKKKCPGIYRIMTQNTCYIADVFRCHGFFYIEKLIYRVFFIFENQKQTTDNASDLILQEIQI